MFGQLNNIGALEPLPIGGKRAGAANAAQERGWPHGSPDLEIPEMVGEVKQPVPKFDVGYIFANVDRFRGGLSFKSHVHFPSLNTTERFGTGPAFLNISNPVTALTWIRVVPFLPTALFERRTAEQFRPLTAETMGA
jgi:hypothetical protein